MLARRLVGRARHAADVESARRQSPSWAASLWSPLAELGPFVRIPERHGLRSTQRPRQMTHAAATARPPETAEQYVARLAAALGSRDPIDVLGRTPDELRRAIGGLDATALGTPEGPGQWSVRQVVQHLADSELVVAVRIRMVLAHDRPDLAAYDQERWAARLYYDQTDVEEALGDFERIRRSTLRLLQHASPSDRARVGIHSERGEESIEQMLVNSAGHDIVHLRQIARIRRALGMPND